MNDPLFDGIEDESPDTDPSDDEPFPGGSSTTSPTRRLIMRGPGPYRLLQNLLALALGYAAGALL